jgi:RsiW-degrading membrane proteinase PrsW (M82 family)
MLFLASALAALIPMVTYLFLIWAFDRYDREPVKLVIISYVWGAVGAIIFAIIGSIIFSIVAAAFTTEQFNLEQFRTVIIAPVVEEITKGFFLLIVINYHKFDNITDGLVYGGAIGLGFGMTENFLYFISYGSSLKDWIIIVVMRSLFSAVMHCISTGTLGAFFGLAKLKKNFLRILLPWIGLLLAMTVHFTWNFSVSDDTTAPYGFLFMFISISIFIVVFSFSVMSEKKIILNQLKEEVTLGTIPLSHPEILSSAKRNRKGWIDEKIRKVYIKSATTLAFRKMQLKNSVGKSREFYLTDIENYRNFIRNLFETSPNKSSNA